MNLDIEDMLKVCVPDRNLCDPQMVADDIRAYAEGAQTPSSEIPTRSGPYWWRAKSTHKWTCVWITGLGYIKAHFSCYEYHPITWKEKHGIGQWLPCIPPMSPKPNPHGLESEVEG